MGGVFGASIRGQNAQMLTYHGLYSLQHRGEYGVGLASDYNAYIDYKKGYGLVTNVIEESDLKLLRGSAAMGMVSSSQNDIPLLELDPKVIGFKEGVMSLCFDGNILNYHQLKKKIEKAGATYENNSHTEVLGQLIALNYKGDLVEAIKESLIEIKGAYALILMHNGDFLGTVDPCGIKPLFLGEAKDGYVFSSETCAIEAVGGHLIRPINPGEILIDRKGELESIQFHPERSRQTCIFDTIYTARPDSLINGKSVYGMRKEAGKILGSQEEIEADVVIGAPDSGTVYAIGFAEGCSIPYGMGIVKNRYVGRTFIDKTEKNRVDNVRIKLNVLDEIIKDRDVIVVDDSIVRGTTMMRTVKMLKDSGAKTVHVRIASPMVFNDCKLGVNQSVCGKMLAKDHTKEEIQEIIGADTLKYVSLEDIHEAFGGKSEYCTGCLDGFYPLELEV